MSLTPCVNSYVHNCCTKIAARSRMPTENMLNLLFFSSFLFLPLPLYSLSLSLSLSPGVGLLLIACVVVAVLLRVSASKYEVSISPSSWSTDLKTLKTIINTSNLFFYELTNVSSSSSDLTLTTLFALFLKENTELVWQIVVIVKYLFE